MEFAAFQLPWDRAVTGAALLVRASAFVATAPVLGTEAAPSRLRIAFAAAVVFMLAPSIKAPPAGAAVVPMIAGEVLVGLMIGYAMGLAIEVALVAGDIVGYPTGLSMASQLDPITQAPTATLTIFYRITALVIFIAIGGPQQMLAALAKSYEIAPCGMVNLSGNFLPVVLSLTARVVSLGVRLAAPVLVSGILCDIFLMLIVRAVPQMNILVVGAPVRLVIGLLAVGLSVGVLVPVLQETLDATSRDALAFLRAVAPAR